jgi:dephospho-CoA kinase
LIARALQALDGVGGVRIGGDEPMIRSPPMLVIGLTGGIGAGKSTVSRLLAQRGAVILDADVYAREVVEPGGPAYRGVVDRFGPGVVLPDGRLDRPALAAIVFGDAGALADLNAIVHPAVGAVIAERLAEEADTDDVVILDVPLLVESGRSNTAAVIVVDCPPEEALRRAVARGLPEEDVRRRMANQVSRDERLAKADFVVDNSGPEAALPAQIDKAWAWIESLPQ